MGPRSPSLSFVVAALGFLFVPSAGAVSQDPPPERAPAEERAPAGAAAGEEMRDSLCLDCHGLEKSERLVKEGRTSSLNVDAEKFTSSVHGALGCIRCHTELPHKFGKPRVECGECHQEEATEYGESVHGQRLAAGDKLAPTCDDCHGVHYILPLGDPASAVAPFNVPKMCAQCHAEGAPVARTHDIPQEQILKRYTQSIHGEGLFKQGLVVTAVCTSCHTGHRVFPHTDPRSTIAKENIVSTCMKCHGQIEAVHRKIIRGTLWEKEPHKVPLCVECHSPHEARRVLYDTRMANADCLFCHGQPDIKSAADGRTLFLNIEEFGASVHGRHVVACTQCHTGVEPAAERPCATIEEKVDCSVCHDAAVADYVDGIHGRLHGRGDPNAPYCTDCHGTHDMMEHEAPADASKLLSIAIRESPTFVLNVPDLCAKCHREGAPAAVRYLGEERDIVEHYTESIHGKGLKESGLTVTATCINCHTPHKELPHTDPESSVHPDNVAETCGKCHDGISEQYLTSIHSPASNKDYERAEDMPDLPRCSDCHTSHTIGRTENAGFKLTIMDQCGKCHEAVTESYFETYHGKVSKLGEANTAKCHDCHGAHDILPATDPRSRLGRENIVATCAQCHPGSHRRFAGYLTHATHHDPEKYPALFYTFWAMTGLLVGTFGFFGFHTLTWLPRSWKARKHVSKLLESEEAEKAKKAEGKKKVFVRFRRRYRAMHLVMILSFFGLAITGMVLKFSYAGWAMVLASVLGGADVAGFIHRFCAVVMLGLFVTHVWDVTRRFLASGRTVRGFFLGPNSMIPQWRDVTEFFGTVRWFVGRGPRPRYGRWTYWEKFDYFAVFWGIGIIGSTGIVLWFPEVCTYVLPGWAINVATIIHSDEALLATGFIFVVHFFNTHFRPEKFPMDTVMFTGRMSLEEFKHERPREYEDLIASGKLDEHLEDPASRFLTHGTKAFGFVAVTVGLCLVVLILYAMLFGYK